MSALLEQEGRVWLRRALSAASLAALDDATRLDSKPGGRIPSLAASVELDAIAATLLPGARPVRVIAFNKTEANNWTLPWHQDRVVALRERIETPGFSNWTNKAGIWHAEPPIELLERMIFARIHLDPADTENGCLQLALGTHARGKIAAADAEVMASASPNEDCIAERGDVLFAKALILHRSSPSRTNVGRRALRIDYSAEPLPPPLEWAS
ncbi:MAG: phytanoyl-CoA dioxygenase family protein [Alphaproteobacteria bacterium]|nr:phytanoyl-CoA dioxygenase family protein [Alphaproteobacteria bacterium]